MNNWPKGYQEKVEGILGSKFSGTSLEVSFGHYNNAEEAKLLLKKMVFLKKQLSSVKSLANDEMKSIRASFQTEKHKVSQSGKTLTTLFFGKKAAGHERQREKNTLGGKQRAALGPYENVKNTIDQILLEMDRVKLEVETHIANNDFE
jgi:hypothetical protein